MCGMFAYDGADPPNLERLEEVAGLAARRGPHASGVAFETAAGVTTLVVAKPWGKACRDVISAVAMKRRVIGHFRLATSGDWRNVANDQPQLVGDTAIAHNGNVPRWRELAAAEGIELRTSCDSELIAHWMDRGETASGVIGKLTGTHAILALRPGTLTAARRGLPLYAWRHPEGTYYCSVDPGNGAELIEETP